MKLLSLILGCSISAAVAQDSIFPTRNPSQIPGTQQRIPLGTGGTNIFNNTYNTYYTFSGTNINVFNVTNLSVYDSVTIYTNLTVNNTTTTNLTVIDSVTINTNLTIKQNISVSGKATFNNLVITNQTAYVQKAWSGPSNTFDITFGTGANRQRYSTVTPVAITGLVKDTGYVEDAILSITNAATTNITITVVAGFKFPSTDTQAGSYTVTNGDYAEILVDYDNGVSNIIIRTFH